MNCQVCNEPIKEESSKASGMQYRRIVRVMCGCGCKDVRIESVIDYEKIKPRTTVSLGYERYSIPNRASKIETNLERSMQLLAGDEPAFFGGFYD